MPVGIAAKGNPGVAGTTVKLGAIGYIGSITLGHEKNPVAKLQNKAGNFIGSPTR